MPAVLRHNLKGEDGRFSQAAVALTGKDNIAGLVDCFNKLITLKVCDLVKNYIPSFEDLLRLQGEMITPGRADNNLVNITSLVELLYEAWHSQDA